MKEINDIEPSTSRGVNRSTNDNNKRKRRASSRAETGHTAKRFIAQDEEDDVFKLLDFTDEVLLEILQNCDSTTLYALSKTCKHFLKLVEDRRLWKTFDFSSKRLMGRQIKKLLITLQIADIKEFKVRGFVAKYPLDKWKNNTITVNLLRKLSSNCPCLETLEIREGYINFQQVKISDFPSTLKRLIFNSCQIPMPRSPRLFTKIDEHIQLLEEISLEKCSWFETHDLVVFSKLPHLKRLILRGCNSLKGCVPYGSIATRFGFKSLEYLDVRDTPISDSDIQCFNITSTLREILMECPIEFRDQYCSTDTASDTDDGEPFEVNPQEDTDSPKESQSNEQKQSSRKDVESQRHIDDSIDSESESDSAEESECSTDSEDGDSGGEDGAAKVSGTNDDSNPPHQAHCIQVVLQNGRMINVNAERSNDFENPLRETNGLRCVIGIINGRDSNESFASAHRVFTSPYRSQKPQGNESDESNASAANTSNGSSSNAGSDSKPTPEKPKQTENNRAESSTNADSINQPGPSGLQTTNQNDSTKASKSNSNSNSNSNENSNNSNDGASPSNGNAANPPNVENRQRLIIVQHRRQPNDDDNGNMNRFSWEVRNLYPYRQVRYHNTIMNGSGNYITDRGLCSFGMPRRNVQEGIIWIRAELRPPDTLLERITVRHYSDVTDVTLRHLALCAPNLRYLDVTGTSVTRRGISTFQKEKPECQVISELLDT